MPYIAEEVSNFVRNYDHGITNNETIDSILGHKTTSKQNRRHWKNDIEGNELKSSGFFLGTCYTPLIAVVAIFAIVAIFLYFLEKVNTKLDAVTQEREYLDIDQNKQSNTVSS